jgi:hypothetical protein
MMDDPNMHAYDHYPDDSDQALPLPPEGHPLLKLGQRLTELLDEDHWAECERLLLEGWEHDRIDRKTGSDWRNNSSLELWFPFSAEELARWKRSAEANIEENVRLRADLDELRHNALAQADAADLIESQAAQIALLREALGHALNGLLYYHHAKLVKRGIDVANEALSATPDQALEQFAERVRDQFALVIEAQDVDPSFKHRMASAIRSLKELPK